MTLRNDYDQKAFSAAYKLMKSLITGDLNINTPVEEIELCAELAAWNYCLPVKDTKEDLIKALGLEFLFFLISPAWE